MLNSEIIAKTLKSVGVRRIFLFPGGTVTPLLDALQKEKIEIVCARNEQGAGYIALGSAKITGVPQIVIVTSGPGATNLLSPVADAYYDSVPMLVFTGQVGTKDINYEKKIRQTGFQQTDTVEIYGPVTKRSHILTFDDDVEQTIINAFNLAHEGRPGPVLIDLPMDVQRAKASRKFKKIKKTSGFRAGNKTRKVSKRTFSQIKKSILNSERPVILAGNGIYLSNSVREFRRFVNKSGIPVIASLPGVGVISSNHPLSFSYLGHTGEFFANLAANFSDLLLVFGARLDLRQTGTELDPFVKGKTIVRVDIDGNELNFGRVKGDINVNSDLKQFFQEFLPLIPKIPKNTYLEWINQIREWRRRYHSSQFYKGGGLHSYDIVTAVDKITSRKKVTVATGVGTHQQIAARYFTYDHPRRKWLTSSGHGTMGYDLPAIVGAMLSETKNTLGVVFVGDGSFQMNSQELATIEEYKLPIKIFVLDDRKLGVVSQFQMDTWGSDPGTGKKRNPSFSKIAKAYGLKGFDIYKKRGINSVLRKVFKDRKPAVVHCHITYLEVLKPMLLGGQQMNEMHPFKGEVKL